VKSCSVNTSFRCFKSCFKASQTRTQV